ncbi:hypothetical protein ABK948_09070 [Citrobacter sp. 70972423]|uniref:hypothetical protein n=1 Tax=Citrobacter sp. 70972423 TaxID=3118148 RepID=UPI003754117D
MSDFKKSFLAGLDSAKKANKNINEIKEVIDSMSNQLSDLTNNKATLGIATFYEDATNPLVRFTANAKKYKGLAIFDGEGKGGVEIAEWTQHESGYPCTISSESGRYYCSNKEELEDAITDLFSQTRTGKIILSKIESN